MNDPIWLAFAQIVVLVLSALIYGRQKSALDVEKRDRGAFATQVSEAFKAATEAKQGVETIELKHYKSLANDFLTCCTKLGQAEARISSLEESLASILAKWASREKTEKKNAKAAEAAAADETPQPSLPTAPGAAGVDDLVRQGLVIPLGPQQPAPAASRNPGFGRVAR